MGGGGSKPAPSVQIVDDPIPSASTSVNVEGSDQPVAIPVNGVSIASAQECDRCSLRIFPNISTSTVKVTREFGDITFSQCSQFAEDEQRVRNTQLAFTDFRARLQNGDYYRFTGSDKTYCEQILFPPDIVPKVNTISDYDANRNSLQSVRIRKVSSGGFSSDTKIQVIPSIPFKVNVQSAKLDKEVIISKMTVYHPSPMRIENVQHDAVLSLNDPSNAGPGDVVILVPLVGSSKDTSSTKFMSRLLSNISNLTTPDPATGKYAEMNTPTGSDWTLEKILPTDPATNRVASGIFIWEGMPELERYLAVDQPYFKRYAWRRKGKAGPIYVMLDTPMDISNSDLAALIAIPVTPPEKAIHAMIDGSLTYKCSRSLSTTPSGTPTTEGFSNQYIQREDPFYKNYEKDYGYSPETAFTFVFNLLMFVMFALGAWFALFMVGDLRADQFFRSLSSSFGKVIVRLFKKSSSAASSVSGNVKSLFQPGNRSLAALGATPAVLGTAS